MGNGQRLQYLKSVICFVLLLAVTGCGAEEKTVTYFRFMDDMKAGETVEASDLEVVVVPEEFKGAFGWDAIRENPNQPGMPMDGIGMRLVKPVSNGEVLVATHFFNPIEDSESVELEEIEN